MADTVLVCVTGQQSSQRLIHRGAEIAARHGAPLLVLSVSGSGVNLLSNPSVSQALNDLYRLSVEVGAEMTMLHHTDAHRAICDFAKERGVTHLVLGQGQNGENPFILRLKQALPQVTFMIEPA